MILHLKYVTSIVKQHVEKIVVRTIQIGIGKIHNGRIVIGSRKRKQHDAILTVLLSIVPCLVTCAKPRGTRTRTRTRTSRRNYKLQYVYTYVLLHNMAIFNYLSRLCLVSGIDILQYRI